MFAHKPRKSLVAAVAAANLVFLKGKEGAGKKTRPLLTVIMGFMLEKIGFMLARYLQKPSSGRTSSPPANLGKFRKTLKPGDVLLVDGNERISIAIKYLTQSTWSHAAVYVGNQAELDSPDPPCLIEADLTAGVTAVPLSKYKGLGLRICRPVNMQEEDIRKLIDFLTSKLGMKYDIKNAIDLLRYLLPEPPVPVRWRRRMLALGSGDPTRAICSTLIAQAFQSVQYPILPEVSVEDDCENGDCVSKEILHIRHHSLFTPRDFDLSPYFQVVKPTIKTGFDYKALNWSHNKDKDV